MIMIKWSIYFFCYKRQTISIEIIKYNTKSINIFHKYIIYHNIWYSILFVNQDDRTQLQIMQRVIYQVSMEACGLLYCTFYLTYPTIVFGEIN